MNKMRAKAFTITPQLREILEIERRKTGKSASLIIRELIASLEPENKEAA